MYNNSKDNLIDFIRNNSYVLLDCSINQNIILDIDKICIHGLYRRVNVEGIINIRNCKEISIFSYIHFKDCSINF